MDASGHKCRPTLHWRAQAIVFRSRSPCVKTRGNYTATVECELESGCAEDVLGVFTGIQIPWHEEMKCPTCRENTIPDRWVDFVTEDPRNRAVGMDFHSSQPYVKPPPSKLLAADRGTVYSFDWMRCGNETCKQLVIRIHATTPTSGHPSAAKTESWVVLPRHGAKARFVDPIVPARFRDDLNEAAAILDLSPRMSAVLARSILADLLEKYAGHNEYGLAARIVSFCKNTTHPKSLRDNLHRFREVADFGAHTKTSDQGEFIKVDREDAEWTLGLVDRLFDYLIVTPAGDEKMRSAIDQRSKSLNRTIKPLPDDPPEPKP